MRYEDVTEDVIGVFTEVLSTRFAALSPYTGKLVFDTKKRTKGNSTVLASVELCSPKLKFFTATNVLEEGYDYVIYLDKTAWTLASDLDKIRIISHELRHVFIDEKGNLKLIDHDITDFVAEVALNTDDPNWGNRLATLTEDAYQQAKELANG